LEGADGTPVEKHCYRDLAEKRMDSVWVRNGFDWEVDLSG
jgi:hypothetical protein